MGVGSGAVSNSISLFNEDSFASIKVKNKGCQWPVWPPGSVGPNILRSIIDTGQYF